MMKYLEDDVLVGDQDVRKHFQTFFVGVFSIQSMYKNLDINYMIQRKPIGQEYKSNAMIRILFDHLFFVTPKRSEKK